MRGLLSALAWLAATGCNQPQDYPPRALAALGMHNSSTYVARDLLPALGLPLLLAHPRLGQPAIARAGDPFDVGWIAPGLNALPVEAALEDGDVPGPPLSLGAQECDADGVCHAGGAVPELAPGLYGLCITVGQMRDCAPGALDIVEGFADPASIVQVTDVHAGDSDSAQKWGRIVDAINARRPAPDLVIFTGDAADLGLEPQRVAFLNEAVRLKLPLFVVTGNHDYDNAGCNHHLIDIGPELDFIVRYGALRLVGLSTGQDLDDGDHLGTLHQGSVDESQLNFLRGVLEGDAPTVVFFHHPLYFALFATVFTNRDELLDAVNRDSVRAVLTGHIHAASVFDRDGESRGLSLEAQSVDLERWPLHYTQTRVTNGSGGYTLHRIGTDVVEYRWVDL